MKKTTKNKELAKRERFADRCKGDSVEALLRKLSRLGLIMLDSVKFRDGSSRFVFWFYPNEYTSPDHCRGHKGSAKSPRGAIMAAIKDYVRGAQ